MSQPNERPANRDDMIARPGFVVSMRGYDKRQVDQYVEQVDAEISQLVAERKRSFTRVQELKPVARDAGLSMAQLAVAWVLQNHNVSSAIIGASRPEQVRENAKAAGVKLDHAIMKRIDETLGAVVVRDPGRTVSPAKRP